jgi:DNA polymerase (family X)
MTNCELAMLFTELADIMEIAGEDHFKIRAYRNAAKVIVGHARSIQDMPSGEIGELSGIGKAISEKIDLAKTTGTFPTLEKWRGSPFAAFQPLLGIPAINMRKLRGLLKDMHVSTVDELIAAIHAGRLMTYGKLNPETRSRLIGYFTSDSESPRA